MTEQLELFTLKQPELKKTNSSIEQYVRQVIEGIKKQDLANDFHGLLEKQTDRKITMRIDKDVYDFYASHFKYCQTAMKAALRTVKNAVEACKLKVAE